MRQITWTREPRQRFWSGAIGQSDYAERFAFSIRQSKSADAPHTYWAAKARKRAGDPPWTYEYVLSRRLNGVVHTVGRFASLDAAKQAAAETLAG